MLNLLNPVTFFQGISGLFNNIISLFNPQDQNFIFSGLFSWLNPNGNSFILTDVISGIGNVLSYLNPLSQNFFGYKIIDLLKSALEYLFVPSEERINAIKSSVSSKFGFVDSIKLAVQSIQNIANNLTNVPRLELSVGSTKYTEAQTLTVIDFSWYAPFKSYGDLIITGFAYFFFVWRIFINLPNIIHGLGGSVDASQMLGDIEAYNKTGFGRSSVFNFRKAGGRR